MKYKTPLSYWNYRSDEMLNVLDFNQEFLIRTEYLSEDDIYEILLKTGQYLKAKDIKYLIMIIIFEIKVMLNI